MPDWSALAPHLPVRGKGYVERPTDGGDRIAARVRAGTAVLLVVGAVGVGKSSELVHAATAMAQERDVVAVGLDRLENLRRAHPLRVLGRLAGAVCEVFGERGLKLPEADVLSSWKLLPGQISDAVPTELVVRSVFGQAARKLQNPVLVLDGLEKTEAVFAREFFSSLGAMLPDRGLGVVAVIPWSAAYGPDSAEVVRAGEQLVPISPIDVTTLEGVRFLRGVLEKRLGTAEWGAAPQALHAEVVPQAIQHSGGVPRTFLQLMADAGAYAALAGESWPSLGHLESALADVRDSYRRLMLPGDRQILHRAAAGDGGTEVPLDARIRLLSHGLLLEVPRGAARVLIPAPLAA